MQTIAAHQVDCLSASDDANIRRRFEQQAIYIQGDFMRYFFAATAAFVLAGCGTMAFTPAEYPLRDGLIQSFPVNGTVAVTNDQSSTAPVIVYSYGGSKLSTNLKAITDVMTAQAQKELQKAGQPAGPGAAKSISLKVNKLLSVYVAFSWKSDIDFEARLGDGQTLRLTAHHASGVLQQDLNGCIAEGVMTLLKDPRVKAYLAAP